MKPTINLIILGTCALCAACSTVRDSARLGERESDHELARFYLPPDQVTDLTLQEALQTLRQSIQDTAKRTGSEPPSFRYKIEGAPERRVSGRIDRGSALKVIRRLALQASMKVTPTAKRLVLTPLVSTPKRAEYSYKVPPTFLHDIEADQASLLATLRREHAILEPDAQVRYNPATSTLIIRSQGRDPARTAEFVKTLIAEIPTMIKLEAKRVLLERARDLPTGPLSPAEARKWLRKTSRTDGASIEILPSVVARPAQTATVEIVQSLHHGDEELWFGTRLIAQPSLLGHATLPNIRYERRLLSHEGRELPVSAGPDLQAGGTLVHREQVQAAFAEFLRDGTALPVRTREFSATNPILDGHYVVARTTGSSRQSEYLLIRVSRIDAAGRTLRAIRN